MKKVNRNLKRYAKSLFNSISIDSCEETIKKLTLFNEIIEKNKEIKSVLVNPLFTKKDKRISIDLIAHHLGLSEVFKKFINNLVEYNFITGLPEIINVLNDLYLDASEKSTVIVMATSKPDTKIEDKLKNTLKKALNREIELRYMIDTTLIGGLIVKVGSSMFDFSLRGQISMLKDELLRGS